MDYSAKENLVEAVFDKVKYTFWPSKDNNYECKFLQSNALLSLVALLLIVKIAVSLAPINFSTNLFFADITRVSLENFANQARQSAGVGPLVDSPKLDEAALLKAKNMVNNNYFDHTSPSGVTPWYWFSQVGYNYKYAGENLAIGFFESKEVYDAWMNSPSHKENLLNPNYTEVGTAVLGGFGNNDTIVVVQLFGSQKPANLATTNVENSNTLSSKDVKIDSQLAIEPTASIGSDGEQLPKSTESVEVDSTQERVLSQSIQSKTILGLPGNNLAKDSYANYINYVLYNYSELVKNVVYGFSMVVIGILLALIFFSPNMRFNKEFMLRTAVILLLLITTSLINKDIFLIIIPHQIII